MTLKMRRIIVLAMVLIVIVAGGAALAVRATRGSIVVATVALNGASGDGAMIADEWNGAILVEDTITATSPAAGASQQPVLRMLDGADGRLVGIVPLVANLDAPFVDRTTGRLLSLANLGGYGHPFAVTAVDLARRTTLYTTALPLPPTVRLMGGYGMQGAAGPGGIVVDDGAGHILAASRVTFGGMGRITFPDRGLTMLDARTGRLLRTVYLPAVPTYLALDARTHHAFVSGGIGSLWLVDSRTGMVQRTLSSGYTTGVVVDERAHRALVSGPTGLRILDTHGGRLLTTVAIPGLFHAPLMVSGGRALAASFGWGAWHRGMLRLLDTRRGRVVWTTPLAGAPLALATDARRGRAYVETCAFGPTQPQCAFSIAVIALADGRVQRAIALSSTATVSAMTVDTRTGHLFIASQRGPPLPVVDPWSGIRNLPPFALPFLPRAVQPTPGAGSAGATRQGSVIVLDIDH